MNEITPVLLAGGFGTRLWPLSRKSYPKQFLKLFSEYSLFQHTALRLQSSNMLKFKPHLTLTTSDFRFFVSQQLIDLGIDPGPIILEPESKNTAPAILLATLFSYKQNPDSILLISPSDHLILNEKEFHNAIKKGLNEVQKGIIITFGIQPTRPDEGFGYLEIEKINSNNIKKIISFVEKPNADTAKNMIYKGNYLWNSGIFLFRAKDMILAFEKHAPEILSIVQDVLKTSYVDLGFLKLEPNIWSNCKNISIDYAIMEKVKNLAVVPFSGGWSDLGGWEAVRQTMDPDINGVSLSSNAHAFECKNTLIRSESKTQEVIGFGLKDIFAIAMPDAVLISHKNKIKDINKIVSYLKSKDISQAEISTKDYRPWGWFENLTISEGFKVKKITVNPHGSLSLQSHKHRSEHWVIVNGKAKVTLGKKNTIIDAGESIFIPKEIIHRIENPFNSALILIEVQIGSYLEEDDITRYEDIYSRK